MGGSYLVHFCITGLYHKLWVHPIGKMCTVPFCSSCRHLLLPFHFLYSEETTSGGQDNDGEGERKEGEEHEWRAARGDEGEARESCLQRAEGKTREPLAEEESPRHHGHYPVCAHNQLFSLHSRHVTGETDTTSFLQVWANPPGPSCCLLLHIPAAAALPEESRQATLYKAKEHVAWLLLCSPLMDLSLNL